MNHVATLVHYLRDVVKEAKKMVEKEVKGEQVDRKAFAKRWLTTKALRAYFENTKEKESKENLNAWEGVVWPV